MKILFYFNHPAHFHLFKESIRILKSKGNYITIVIKKKDVLEDLLSVEGWKYYNVFPKDRKNTKLAMALSLLKRDLEVFKIALINRPTIMIGTSIEITHIGKILRIPSIHVNEDDVEQIPQWVNLSYPFASSILAPYSCNSFCFSYSPFDKQIIFNASMKGSRLLSQVYSITKDSGFLELASKSVEFVINHQNSNGSWFYSKKKTGEWVDNYHTGYVLDCLSEYISLTGDKRYTENLNSGIEYYVKNFFESNRVPKFYNNKTFPVDCTAGGQSILTLTRFGYLDLAKNVAEFMLKNMQDKKGYFYFRNYGNIINKTSFMRWSNAWMFAALSNLLFKVNGKNQ